MAEISIIMPVYNKEKFLRKSIDSVLNQTYKDYELIIIDDGSNDDSAKMADEYSKNHKQIMVIHIKNSGVSNARNIGISSATGKYITFIDSDDYCQPDYLLNLYNCITQNRADMVISGLSEHWEYSDNKKFIQPALIGLFQLKDVLPNFARMQIQNGIFGFSGAKIFKKELCKDIYFDNQISLAEDFDFFLKLYSRVSTIYFDNNCYYYYLQQAANSTSTIKDENIDYYSQILINLRFKNFLEKNNSFQGENQAIVNKLINNYIFFTIYHSSVEALNKKFDSVYYLIKNENINLVGDNIRQKFIFYCLNRNLKPPVKTMLVMYRHLKVLRRR